VPIDDLLVDVDDDPITVVIEGPAAPVESDVAVPDLGIAITNPETELTDVPSAPGSEEILAVPVPGPKGDKGDKGDQGDQGIPGESDDKTYHHIQDVPNMHVTVVHGLGKYPSVTVKDTVGTQIEAMVTYVDMNTVTIDLSALFAWTADFN
jgi:hypothetical protein